jgi:hypothetical protein
MSSIAVVVSFVLIRSLRVQPVEALGWSWKRAISWLPVTLGCAVVAALVMGLRFLVFGPDSGMAIDDTRLLVVGNLSISLLMGLAAAVVLGVVPGNRENHMRPNEGISQSLRNGLLIGVPSSLVVAVVLAYVAVPQLVGGFIELRGPWLNPFALAVRYAVLFAAVMFLVYGGAAVLFHAALRVVLALRTPLPLNLVGFLDHAAACGLLRRVGGGYMFLHRTLLDYFALPGRSDAPRS